jgi:hypothetical protein
LWKFSFAPFFGLKTEQVALLSTSNESIKPNLLGALDGAKLNPMHITDYVLHFHLMTEAEPASETSSFKEKRDQGKRPKISVSFRTHLRQKNFTL